MGKVEGGAIHIISLLCPQVQESYLQGEDGLWMRRFRFLLSPVLLLQRGLARQRRRWCLQLEGLRLSLARQ